MRSFHRNRRMRFLRRPGRILVALVVGLHLIAGALHGLYDLDVASPSGTTIASTNRDGAPSEKAIAAEHHCHGCFSVSMPAPMTAAADLKPARDIVIPHEVLRRGLQPGIDPPPPKFLT